MNKKQLRPIANITTRPHFHRPTPFPPTPFPPTDPISTDSISTAPPFPTLLLYTDGVTESVNANGEEYSGERLIETLKPHGNSNAQSILNHVMDSVHRFSGEEGQPDDLTLIAIKHS